jgi:cobalamin synthase
MATDRKRESTKGDKVCAQSRIVYFSHLLHLCQSYSQLSNMKDPRQGAAAIVFLVFYVLAFAFTVYCLVTRRGKRHVFSVFLFNLLRIGANISSLGWAIHLYDNFDWLVASLILGTEGKQ